MFHSLPSQTLFPQANHNIVKEAELLDFPAEIHVHSAIDDIPCNEISISGSETSSPGDFPNTSDISLFLQPCYPTRHCLPPDRGPFNSH